MNLFILFGNTEKNSFVFAEALVSENLFFAIPVRLHTNLFFGAVVARLKKSMFVRSFKKK